MSIDRFQGDPKLTLDENGADLTFKGGQPIMDRGLENAVFISLFTKPGWWGNILFTENSQKIGSDYVSSTNQPITITALNEIANAAERALRWMLDTKLASTIKSICKNPISHQLQSVTLIEPPGELFLVEKNGLNWQSQKIDPAYLKVQ